ncbi:MAG: methyltransferase [Dehalococcoidia bacterium]
MGEPEFEDPYFRRRISFAHKEHDFAFDVAHTLFSGHEVDQGTGLLLRALDADAPRSVLDLGCGYGVLGIVLARLYPEARVVLADSDLLAVRYARHNCELNELSNAEVVASVGMEDVPSGPYDLIVSNIPAKIGDEAIEREFILAPLERLGPAGAYWFVAVSGLNRLIPKLGTRNDLRLSAVRKRAGHTVYRVVR